MERMKPHISVIVAVYNHFEWLRLVLDALRRQTYFDFEVIIADDGSNQETVRSIREYQAAHPEFSLIHLHHADEGWRKNICLNNAVREARGDYLVFIDGDCIPHPQFLEDHFMMSKKGQAASGRRVDMSKAVSDMVESWTTLPPDYFRKARKEVVRNILRTPLTATLSQLRRFIHYPYFGPNTIGLKSGGMLGCNMGMFKSDLEKINGFDERYLAPGVGEDTDLELRLRNAGIKCVKSSRYALMLHRCHPRLPMDSPDNRRLLEEAREKKTTWVARGLKR
ncbi:MAG: glycosyltransferase [Bacteroides sp.]|nr:glycosyltransferase [Bacteroides sp.]